MAFDCKPPIFELLIPDKDVHESKQQGIHSIQSESIRWKEKEAARINKQQYHNCKPYCWNTKKVVNGSR